MEYANKVSHYLETKIHIPSIAIQYLESPEEYINQGLGLHDPIGDQLKWSAPQLIHRYKNRALFLPTLTCPVNCRFCFRKNLINEKADVFKPELGKTINYLKDNPEIEELIFTGGDPFILSVQKLQDYLANFAQISTLRYIRFHTRVPCASPELINKELIQSLIKYKDRFHINVMVHINHKDELFVEVKESLKLLMTFGIKVYSQTVLLKDLNNKAAALKELFKEISSLGVIPYYLHHPDKVKGAMHFYISEEEGLRIYGQVKSELSGWMLPKYVIDSPEASGKTLVLPT